MDKPSIRGLKFDHVGHDTAYHCFNCGHHHCLKCSTCHRCGCQEYRANPSELKKVKYGKKAITQKTY